MSSGPNPGMDDRDVAAKRLLVLVSAPENGKPGGVPRPLGTSRDIKEALARFNTAPDGSTKKSLGTEFYYGPGIQVELPSGQSEVNQALVTLIEEDIAWPVLLRMCRTLNWALQDPNTGRIFGAGPG